MRQIEEDMQQKRQMVLGGRPPNMNNGNFDNRGPPPRGPMGPPGRYLEFLCTDESAIELFICFLRYSRKNLLMFNSIVQKF